MNTLLITLVAALALAGCASSTPEMTVAYVSPIIYESYTCAQLGREAERMSAQAAEATGAQSDVRQSQPSTANAAIVIAWPVASLGKSSGGYATEPGRLERLRKASAARQCATSTPSRSG